MEEISLFPKQITNLSYYTFHRLKEWISSVKKKIYIYIYDNNKPIASNIGIIRLRANERAITVASSGGGGGRIVAVCLFMRETGRPVITAEPPPTTFRQRATRCRIVDLGGKYIIARSFDNWSREISFTGTLKLAGSKEGERPCLNWAVFRVDRADRNLRVFTLRPIFPPSYKTRTQIYVN